MTGKISVMLEIVQLVWTIITIAIIFISPIRARVLTTKGCKRDEQRKTEIREEAERCSLRNIITTFYYSRRSSCELHQYEYENLEKVYNVYKQMKGNSFVDKIWLEMKEWTIVS